MKPDDFEQQLQRQPLRQVPADWRREILAAAQEQSPAGATGIRRPAGQASSFMIRDWLSSLLWPAPSAWAGLAAVWLILLAANHTPSSETKSLARNGSRPSSELITTWQEKERLLSELIQPPELTERKPSSSQPRSQRPNDSPIT